MCLDGTLKSCYNINKEGNDRRSLPEFWLKITAFSLQLRGGYFFLLKDKMLSITAVKPVVLFASCVKIIKADLLLEFFLTWNAGHIL